MRASIIALLIALMPSLTACESSSQEAIDTVPMTIAFEARVGQDLFSCGDSYPAVGPLGDFMVNDFRLYVHDVALIAADGARVPVDFVADGVWQSETTAFLDFEDGTGACTNGNAATRTEVVVAAPPGDYVGLEFRIGVPFDDNHADPIQAGAPLGLTSMHWGWQAGHKFMRFGASDGENAVVVHLGSTGCQGTIGDISHCNFENRPVVEVPEFFLSEAPVVLDVAPLFSRMTADATSCMGNATDPACESVFLALGLDTASGQPSEAAPMASSLEAN